MNPADFLKHFAININDTPGRETFVFKVDKKDQHYTVQVRHHERVLDVHLTRELEGGRKEYTTLFRTSFHQIDRFVTKTRRAVRSVERDLETTTDPLDYFGVRSINAGWFRRSFMTAMPAELSKLNQIGLLRFQKGGRRIRIARHALSIDPDTLLMPIDRQLPKGLYIVQRTTKGGSLVFAGVLLVVPSGLAKRFLYLSKRRLNRMITDHGRKAFKEELAGHAHGVVDLPMAVKQRFILTSAT